MRIGMRIAASGQGRPMPLACTLAQRERGIRLGLASLLRCSKR